MRSGKWDVRIARARDLAAKFPSASQGLHFYEHAAKLQKSLYAELESKCGTAQVARDPGTLRQELDLFILLPRFGPFLGAMGTNSPSPLRAAAAELQSGGGNRWQKVLTKFWQAENELDAGAGAEPGADSTSNSNSELETLFAWTFLQPYAEYLADYTAHPPIHATPPICPLCSSKPLVGVLRPEGDGGKRSLICSLCATEWNYRRLVCPGCGEEDVHKLAVYSAKEISSVRVEACDTCHQYIKTVDMTKDGNAVPVVDELATLPLNLWAQEHSYTKIQTNLLGI
jgi:formate dehydrogenase maturation protein FdhE